jgi:hypothetical protein
MSDMRRRTRWLRELAEPQPVRRADVRSFDRAAQSVGLDGGLARGTFHARLVYKPEQNASHRYWRGQCATLRLLRIGLKRVEIGRSISASENESWLPGRPLRLVRANFKSALRLICFAGSITYSRWRASKKTRVGRNVPKAWAEPDRLICCSLDVTTSAEPHTKARTSTSC